MPVINSPPPTTTSTTDSAVSETTALALSSPSLPTPAADNLYEKLNFKSKKHPPQNVQFLPAHAQIPSVPFNPQPAGQPPLVPQHISDTQQAPNPSHSITDPVRYASWGPKTVYYVSSSSDDSTTHKGSSRSSSSSSKQHGKSKKERGHRFEK
ncbi:MAG: hypothetical protein Q9228_008001, partial [Teloschistes exilis]